jgi:hypothetical protein
MMTDPFTHKPRKLQLPGALTKPGWSIYDIRDNPEWLLAESYVTEYTDIVGIECTYYIKNPDIVSDPLYGETPDVEYLDGKTTKIIYDVGEIQTLYSMFGMMATDQLIIHIPQSVYVRDVSQEQLPKPGDVIKIGWYTSDFTNDYDDVGRTFEVVHAAQDQAIFQLRSLVYVLYLKPYRFSEESDTARDVSSDLEEGLETITDFGDNSWIDTQSEALSAYDGVDTSVYGY